MESSFHVVDAIPLTPFQTLLWAFLPSSSYTVLFLCTASDLFPCLFLAGSDGDRGLSRVRQPAKTSLQWRWGEPLQMQHFILCAANTGQARRFKDWNDFKTVWKTSKVDFQTVSRLHRGFSRWHKACQTKNARKTWETLVNMMNGYRCVWMPSHVHIIRHKLLQFKTIHRTYYIASETEYHALRDVIPLLEV